MHPTATATAGALMRVRSSEIPSQSFGDARYRSLVRHGAERRLSGDSVGPLDLASIFPPSISDTATELERAVAPGRGLVIIGGPTGSGRHVTYSALVRHLIASGRQVGGIEDTHAALVKAHPELGEMVPGFPVSDGDVILADEFRETAELQDAVSAASGRAATSPPNAQGHVVLGMLHASRLSHCFQRIVDLRVDLVRVAPNVRFVACQSLVKRLCQVCSLSGEPQGCDECNAGYNGWAALAETMDLSGRDTEGMENADFLLLEPDQSYEEHAVSLIASRITTRTEVRRVLGHDVGS